MSVGPPSTPPPGAPPWWLPRRNAHFDDAFDATFAVLSATSRMRRSEVAPEVLAQAATDVAEVASFWKAIFADDASYEEFPNISHAYDPHHTVVVMMECRTGFEYDAVVYLPLVKNAHLIPDAREIRHVYARASTTLSQCRLLLKKRIMFAHDVTLPDRRDPLLLRFLGYTDRLYRGAVV